MKQNLDSAQRWEDEKNNRRKFAITLLGTQGATKQTQGENVEKKNYGGKVPEKKTDRRWACRWKKKLTIKANEDNDVELLTKPSYYANGFMTSKSLGARRRKARLLTSIGPYTLLSGVMTAWSL